MFKNEIEIEKEIRIKFVKIGFPIFSVGTNYLIEVIKLYYSNTGNNSIDYIYNIVAHNHDISKILVKSRIRHSIDAFNTSANRASKLYISVFEGYQSLTPKKFIEFFVNYLKYIE